MIPGSPQRLLSFAANLPFFRLEGRAALELTERAWRLGDPARTRTLTERNAQAMAKTMAGDPSGPALLVELAREARKDLQIGHQMGAAVGWPLVWVEEYDAARACSPGPSVCSGQVARCRHLPQSLIELAELDFRVGRWVPALAGAHEAMELFEETGSGPSSASRRARSLGWRLRWAGTTSAGATRRRASQPTLSRGSCSRVRWQAPRSGSSELGRGDPEAAMVALEPVERTVREGGLGEPWLLQWAPDLIEACSHAGRTERAAEILDTFEHQARGTGCISALAAAARCRGIFALDDAFEAHFEAALELHDRVPTPFERGRTSSPTARGYAALRAGRRRASG